MKKEYLDLDLKKLEDEEDRRFLLDRYLSEVIATHQGKMYNTTVTISILAILLSGFSIVSLTGSLSSILIYSAFSLVGLIWYVNKYKTSQLKLSSEIEKIRINYDELFKHHFAYAKKKQK